MLKLLRRLLVYLRELIQRVFPRASAAPPPDHPLWNVREPRPVTPSGKSSSASVVEPRESENVEAIGSSRPV